MAIEEAKRGTASEGVDRDRERILYLHREWWEANNGLDIPRMSRVFPEGDHYLMFNLQGHPYYGIAEKRSIYRSPASCGFRSTATWRGWPPS